ncbi:carboxymuconolactone decarboxylase family protein [Paracoccus alkanivorans]|uniref:Carboxymuconolactone decarboxylase family protein n=1 Tax=Paracoccus alkanivorans TaxID=2116655 RepID=A0A3M0MNR1_9RHOB|nr:carboxymuconolactone decarboxylase family protein [Paracoccus alkanivorans]RMC37964.1 carboxymuconolactone decarboxylase family protein [Paracoccus alkanivorans]
MVDTAAQLTSARRRMEEFAKSAPGLMQGFAAVSKAATASHGLDSATRELIAVSIAVAKGCDDCILYHIDAARKHGASEDAVIAALEVAVEMGGGPAVMYAAKALEAWRAA